MLDAAIITARGGSKGLPGKNILPLGDYPLIAWTIRAAIASHAFARVVVNTDNAAIAAIAREWGAEVPFMRPPELATSTATSASVIVHALDALGIGGPFALLQPTSPFRNGRHIAAAAELFAQHSAPAVVSVAARGPLEWLWRLDDDGALAPAMPTGGEVTRRQDARPSVCPNGAIYLIHAETFLAGESFMPAGTLGFPMGLIDSIDIDDAEDFAIAQALVGAGQREIDT